MPPPNRQQLKEKLRRLPDSPGVYLMKDRFGTILYIGKAKMLKRRVTSYFQSSRRHQNTQPKIRAMVDLVHDVDIIEVNSESEALLLEGKLIKQWKPKYNTDFVDDKHFLLIRVDIENPLPRFRLVRFRQSERSLYYGPFANSGHLRKTLAEMRLKFGILLHDAQPLQQADGSWKIYDDMRADISGHSNLITTEDYQQRVELACTFLDGKSKDWLKQLELNMLAAAAEQNFEQAADHRDLLFALRSTLERTRKFVRDPLLLKPTRTQAILEDLAEALSLPQTPTHIECFDISHISGSFCVASMVHFAEGRPDKAQYRRFKIKSFVGNDDFRAMEEVVGRRYARLHRENKPFPNLIIIDGGRGQVSAALKAFLARGLEPPDLIGLAKKEETVIFTDHREPLKLPDHSQARRLLQRIRDEAHRFANAFNAELRSKRIRETILDDFPNLGPTRRAALLSSFKTIQNLKAASAEDLLNVTGIGPKLAQSLYHFLQQQSESPEPDQK